MQTKQKHASFEDGTGHVIGHWKPKFSAVGEADIVPSIYVDHLKDIIQKITEGGLTVALFQDPAGNVLGIWQRGSAD